MKKVVVTGGAGFVGSHLCDSLIKKNYYVVCIDNLITGSKGNIKHLLANKNFEYLQKDVTKSPLDIKGVDYVFHLASPASPTHLESLAEEIMMVNSVGTLNSLKMALNNKARFLFASTSEAYGDPLEHPQKETYWGNVNPFGPRSCYDESKRFGEALCYVYIHKFKIDVRVIRIFNTYGPRMKKEDGRVVSTFINQALVGEPLTVFGKGNQTRSFCYVTDLVRGIEKVMFTKNLMGQVVNLGNPKEYTVLDLAKKVIKLTKSSSKVVFKSLPKDDPTRRRPDIFKAKKILSWEPKISLEQGLKKTIAYYQNLV